MNRLQTALLEHDFVIQYKKGSNMPADYLSRLPGAKDNIANISAFDPFQTDLYDLQMRDEILQPYISTNLAQNSRHWMSLTLLTGMIILLPPSPVDNVNQLPKIIKSSPHTLIQWDTDLNSQTPTPKISHKEIPLPTDTLTSAQSQKGHIHQMVLPKKELVQKLTKLKMTKCSF